MPQYYIDKKEFKIITQSEIEPYIQTAKTLHQDAALCIALSWLTGCRIRELVNLRVSDILIDQDDKSVMFAVKALKHGKIGYPSFFFSDHYIESMRLPALAGRSPNDYVLMNRSTRRYQQVLFQCNAVLKGADYSQWITFHQLRHSRTTYLARVLKAFPEELKSWFGHRANTYEEYYAPRRVDRFRGRIE